MRQGSHNDPVRPKGAGRKRSSIPKVKRSAITYRHHSDERMMWQRGK